MHAPTNTFLNIDETFPLKFTHTSPWGQVAAITAPVQFWPGNLWGYLLHSLLPEQLSCNEWMQWSRGRLERRGKESREESKRGGKGLDSKERKKEKDSSDREWLPDLQ